MENKSLSINTSEKILDYIIKNNLKPLDKLPNEYELMDLFNVGRNTIRESLKILSSRNIIDIKQGSGTYVSEKVGISDDPLGFLLISDKDKLIKDIFEFRSIIEPEIAEMAALNATEDDINELESILSEMSTKIEKKEDFLIPDQNFHIKLAQISNNLIIENLIPVLSAGMKIFSEEVFETEYKQTLKSHKELFNAIKSNNPRAARETMTFHLLFNKERFFK